MTPGTLFAGYRIDTVVGRGGMGVVYRAVQLSLNRPVALKVIAPPLVAEESARRRFVSESNLAASLDHPNVIPIYDAGEDDGIAYIAMRFVTGVNLHELVGLEGRLEPRRAVHVVRQVAAALDAAHGAGLVHRDVKPANILLGKDDHAYLCDFGLTKRTASDSGQTRAGQLLGTPDFAAPEQFRGDPVGPPADIYALGGVLYFALTGAVPSRPPANAQAPAALNAVVARALDEQPDNRYPSAAALGAAAERALTGAMPPTAPTVAAPDAPARRRTWPRLAIGAILLAATVAAVIILLAGRDGPPPAARTGRVRISRTEPGQTLGEFARRKRQLGQEVSGLSDAAEALVGAIVHFEVTAVGFAGQTLLLRWSLFDAQASKQLDTQEQSRLQIDATRDRVADFTWIHVPGTPRSVYIAFELYDPRGTQLSTARTRAFSI
jgi:hypothetical protein